MTYDIRVNGGSFFLKLWQLPASHSSGFVTFHKARLTRNNMEKGDGRREAHSWVSVSRATDSGL